MRKKLAAVGLTAGLAAGGAAGFAFTSGAITVSAQDDTTTTTVAPAERPAKVDRSARLQETLKPLVDDGTITQAQADKVIETLLAAKPDGGRGGPGGEGGLGGRGPGRGFGGGAGLDAAAGALGITVDELRTELRDGKSIKDVAEAKGVEVQKVIDALVAEAKDRLDQAVQDGKITQEQADERAGTITDRITAMVNGERPEGGPGGPGGKGGWGHGPEGG